MTTASIRRLAVIGAGAWGTALAVLLRRNGHEVSLWARRAELADRIAARRVNSDYLPGVALDAAIGVTTNLASAAGADAVLMAVPAQHLREVATRLTGHVASTVPILLCAKGIERGSLLLMTEVAAEVLPGRPLAVLSGPTFAAEVARGLPTAATLATSDRGLSTRFVAALGTRSFRPYLSDDPIGAEVGGAVKNVLAIACGIVAGRGLGENARAALITRGLAEITRLAIAKGGRAETLMGLSGLGDITLTCTSGTSRNTSLGMALGQGHPLAELLASRRSVAEGAFSAAPVVALAERLGVDMPIAQAVDAVLNRGADLSQVIGDLLARPFTSES
ncbi:MAG: NAD(P)-dependent glycerol-3-phosphate dehydrogenase [Alphaproteobacteria bacterium]|nr:NAD(P)-dependent glycerol-3-phosphate dehydrogenase [Alphaproteobacteria bacterium]